MIGFVTCTGVFVYREHESTNGTKDLVDAFPSCPCTHLGDKHTQVHTCTLTYMQCTHMHIHMHTCMHTHAQGGSSVVLLIKMCLRIIALLEQIQE